jgi:undecaprenyl-diphosphatase
MSWLEVAILSLVEGLTEFLPISSTGHLILTSALFGIQEDNFVKSFNIIIQFGAILSVLTIYSQRFKWDFAFYQKLFLAFIPAAIIGLLIKSKIDLLLGSVIVVSWALIIGGVLLIWSDFYFAKRTASVRSLNELSPKKSILLGFIQCLAFIPGVSRAGATIVGGLFLGLNKKDATEFSFFLAVPTLTAAAGYKSISVLKNIETEHIQSLLLGLVLSYIFALIAIRFFIKLVERHGFKHFGVYRIILGALILFFHSRGQI